MHCCLIKRLLGTDVSDDKYEKNFDNLIGSHLIGDDYNIYINNYRSLFMFCALIKLTNLNDNNISL